MGFDYTLSLARECIMGLRKIALITLRINDDGEELVHHDDFGAGDGRAAC
jgi:hypothetical protein